MSTASIIDGKAIAQVVRQEVKADVAEWVAEDNRAPYLAVVLVGEDPASASYVRGKGRACDEVGIESDTLEYESSISEEKLLAVIENLNQDDSVDGILVQLPLPDHISDDKVIMAIAPSKDVDGFHPENAGRMLTGRSGFVPATPAGMMELLRRSGVETSGKRAVVIGRSNIVGKPMTVLLAQKGVDATVTMCHSRTKDLQSICSQADILIAAIGRPGYVTAEMIKEGAVVLDVGINRVDDASRPRGYRLVGDVDFEGASGKASLITPVPGGVGPMTIALLLRNTLAAARGSAYTD